MVGDGPMRCPFRREIVGEVIAGDLLLQKVDGLYEGAHDVAAG